MCCATRPPLFSCGQWPVVACTKPIIRIKWKWKEVVAPRRHHIIHTQCVGLINENKLLLLQPNECKKRRGVWRHFKTSAYYKMVDCLLRLAPPYLRSRRRRGRRNRHKRCLTSPAALFWSINGHSTALPLCWPVTKDFFSFFFSFGAFWKSAQRGLVVIRVLSLSRQSTWHNRMNTAAAATDPCRVHLRVHPCLFFSFLFFCQFSLKSISSWWWW